jgi:hypothetical protein
MTIFDVLKSVAGFVDAIRRSQSMLCTEEIVQKVWEKGIVDGRNDPKYWRLDACGAWISRSEYGRQQSLFGWEINYIRAQTGIDGQRLSNLRPMQWKNNAHSQEGNMVCVLKAAGVRNCDITLPSAIQ